jgi:hypothetical protein
MSAFGGKADIDWTCSDVRFWHKADIPIVSANVRFWGVKRTLVGGAAMSAFDPKRTFMPGFCCNAQGHTSSDVLSYKFLCLGGAHEAAGIHQSFWKRRFFLAAGRA